MGDAADATRDPATRAVSPRVMAVPESVSEIRLDLRRPRLIRVTGIDRDRQLQEYHLKVTRKGRLTLV